MSSPPVSAEQRVIPSDATLVWLASERTAPLFRTLDRTRAFGPLVVLLSVLPPVLATFAEVVTAEDAAWGLRALDATGSPLPPQAAASVEAVVPADQVRPAALWLSAALLRISDPARPVSASLASLLGGAMLLSLLWPLAKSLGGRRFAFWAVLIAAFHPVLTALLLDPVPVTVALSLAVTALWGHLNMNGKPHRLLLASAIVSLSTMAGLLLVGPAAITVSVVIVLDAVMALFIPGTRVGDQRQNRGSAGAGAIAACRIAAALVGVLLWIAVEQFVLVEAVVAGNGVPAGVEPIAEELMDLPMEVVVIGPLWGLAVIGFGRLLRVISRRASQRSSLPAPRLLFVWFLASTAAILWTSGPDDHGFDPVGRYTIALFSLPFLLTAAYAIEEASRRMISGAWVLLAIALPLAVRLGSLMATFPTDGFGIWIVLAAVGLTAAWLIAKVIPAIVPQTGMRRGALMAAVLAAITVNSADGLGELFRPQRDDDAYRRLIADLDSRRGADAVVLLTAFVPPPELTFAIRATFPKAAMEIASSWDEAAARLEGRFGLTSQEVAVAAWGMRDGVGANSADELLPAGEPLLFAGRELLLYTSAETAPSPGQPAE